MGCHAPSANEVNRYALRLDNSKRSQADRIGFGIVFVNETSRVSAEFLTRDSVDFCRRKADGTRLVFCAELDDHGFHAVVEHANQRRKPRVRGLLGNLLGLWTGRSLAAGPDRMSDKLRPSGLRPAAFVEDTHELLEWWCDHSSSFLGVGEAIQFTQRRGIGCNVRSSPVFTDVGDFESIYIPLHQACRQTRTTTISVAGLIAFMESTTKRSSVGILSTSESSKLLDFGNALPDTPCRLPRQVRHLRADRQRRIR
jgi:hypothetical protein